MTQRQSGTPGIAFVVAAVVLTAGGWGISVWLRGRAGDPAAPIQAAAAFGALAILVLFLLRSSLVRRRTVRWDRFQALAPTAAAGTDGDEVALVERLVIERNQAMQDAKRMHSDLNQLEVAVTRVVSGERAIEWPAGPHVAALTERLKTVLADREEDERTAAELVGIWIERLERLRLRLEIFRRTTADGRSRDVTMGGEGKRTGGEEPTQPSVSMNTLLSRHLEELERDLARLEDDARTLRRRLGGPSAEILSDDDFVL